MSKYLFKELRYSIFSRGMVVAVIAGTVILFQGVWKSLWISSHAGASFYGVQYIVYMHGSGVFDLLAPILAVLPAVTSFCEEYHSKYLYFIKLKTKGKYYIASKALSVGLSGGVAVGAPNMIANSLLLLCGKTYTVGVSGQNPSIYEGTVLDSMEYILDGWLVNGCITFFAFLFGAAWALAGLAVAALTVNRYAALMLPFASYFTIFMIFSRLDMYVYSPINLICPDLTLLPSIWFVIGYLLLLVSVFLAAAVAGLWRRWRE